MQKMTLRYRAGSLSMPRWTVSWPGSTFRSTPSTNRCFTWRAKSAAESSSLRTTTTSVQLVTRTSRKLCRHITSKWYLRTAVGRSERSALAKSGKKCSEWAPHSFSPTTTKGLKWSSSYAPRGFSYPFPWQSVPRWKQATTRDSKRNSCASLRHSVPPWAPKMPTSTFSTYSKSTAIAHKSIKKLTKAKFAMQMKARWRRSRCCEGSESMK